jgi:hypothetical protein
VKQKRRERKRRKEKRKEQTVLCRELGACECIGLGQF